MTRYKFDDIEVSEKFQKGYNALEGILNCLKPADMYIVQASDIINPDPELGYICHVVTDSFIKELEEELDKLRVFTQVSNKFIDTCETPFFNRCEDLAYRIADLKIDEIMVNNNLDIKDEELSERHGYSINKDNISFEDILINTDFGKVLKQQYELYDEMINTDESKRTEYSDFIDTVLSYGSKEYIPQWAENLSFAIDILPIIGDAKTLIEAAIGQDLITGRELSELERGICLLSSIPLGLDIKNIGKIVTKGCGFDVAEYLLKELGQNVGSYVVSKGLEEVGLNPIVTMILFQVGKIGYNKLDQAFNISEKLSEYYSLRKADFKNTINSKATNIAEVIKSCDEVNGNLKITFKDKLGNIVSILMRKEDLTPYQRYICFNGCFIAGTLVSVKGGLKRIEDIVEGDYILSKNIKTNEISYKQCSLIRKIADELVEIEIKGKKIKTTKNHLFMTDQYWKSAEDIKIGDKIETSDGKYEVVENINKKGYNQLKVYNLEIEENHTYYVGEDKLLVHNEYDLKNLVKIYDDYAKGITDSSLKSSFNETLDAIKKSGNEELLKEFDNNLKDIKADNVDGLKNLLGETNGKLGKGFEGVGEAVEDVKYGEHFTKVDRKKVLKPNVCYETVEGYKYKTNDVGAITEVEGTLKLGEGNRNLYAQRIAGGDYRLPDDDGGHLIASQFLGSGELDNLVPMNSQINRSGGKWYNMEQEWANALKEGKEVKVKIEPIYDSDNLRPVSFKVKYNIDGQRTKIIKILNQAGG